MRIDPDLNRLIEIGRCEVVPIVQVKDGHSFRQFKLCFTTKEGYNYVENTWHLEYLPNRALRAIKQELDND